MKPGILKGVGSVEIFRFYRLEMCIFMHNECNGRILSPQTVQICWVLQPWRYTCIPLWLRLGYWIT